MCQLKVFCRTDPRGDTRSAGTPIRQRGLTAEEIYVMLLRSGGSSDRQYKALGMGGSPDTYTLMFHTTGMQVWLATRDLPSRYVPQLREAARPLRGRLSDMFIHGQ